MKPTDLDPEGRLWAALTNILTNGILLQLVMYYVNISLLKILLMSAARSPPSGSRSRVTMLPLKNIPH